MATSNADLSKLAQSGKINLQALQAASADAQNDDVTIEGWDVCYSDDTLLLNEYCTVVANSSSNPITGVGMLMYSSNGVKLYASQYTNGFSGDSVPTSVATNQYTPQANDQMLCVVYGWTQNAFFYFTQQIAVGEC